MVPVAIVVTVILLFILLVLQMAYIRTRIFSLQQTLSTKDADVQTQARSMMVTENKMRIYALVLDLDASSIIALGKDRLAESVHRDCQIPSLTLPYVCDANVFSVPATINKLAVLICKDTPGSQSLMRDLQAGEVKYLILSQEVYMVQYIPTLRDKILIPYFQEEHQNTIANSLMDKVPFVLYSIANHTIATDETSSFDECLFAMQPFIGSIRTKSGTKKLMDPRTDILNVSNTIYPIHVIGYHA